MKRGESLILTDPKSELYESMSEYLRDNGYTVKVFNLIEMDHSDSWNSLNEVGSSELMAQTFADIVLQNTSGDSKDAFWYNAELNLLKALVLYVALEMPPEQRNLATVYDLLYTQTEKGLSDIMASISHEHVNQYTGELLPPSPAAGTLRHLQAVQRYGSNQCHHWPRQQAGRTAGAAGAEHHFL